MFKNIAFLCVILKRKKHCGILPLYPGTRRYFSEARFTLMLPRRKLFTSLSLKLTRTRFHWTMSLILVRRSLFLPWIQACWTNLPPLQFRSKLWRGFAWRRCRRWEILTIVNLKFYNSPPLRRYYHPGLLYKNLITNWFKISRCLNEWLNLTNIVV